MFKVVPLNETKLKTLIYVISLEPRSFLLHDPGLKPSDSCLNGDLLHPAAVDLLHPAAAAAVDAVTSRKIKLNKKK